MSDDYWGNPSRRLKLAGDIKEVIAGNHEFIHNQIGIVQGAIVNQLNNPETPEATKKGLAFLGESLEAAKAESELITELAREAARSASSVNSAWNSRRHNTPEKLKARSEQILQQVRINDSAKDFLYSLKQIQLVIKGNDSVPVVDNVSAANLKEEATKTAKAFIDVLLPDFASETVYRYAGAILAKGASTPLADSLRHDIAADLKQYDNIPIPDEFEGDTGKVVAQKSSYKGQPFKPPGEGVEVNFKPPGNLAPVIGDKFSLKIAVIVAVEAGAIVILKAGQIVSAVVGAITSLAASVAAWMYLIVVALIAVLAALFIKVAMKILDALKMTGRYFFIFAVANNDEVDISYACLSKRVSEREVSDAIMEVYGNLTAYSVNNYKQIFVFVAEDSGLGKATSVEFQVLYKRWLTGGYLIFPQVQPVVPNKLPKETWVQSFRSLNQQVDELFRFQGEIK